MFPNGRRPCRLTSPIVRRSNGDSGIVDKISLLTSCFGAISNDDTRVKAVNSRVVNRKKKKLFAPNEPLSRRGRRYWRLSGSVGFWRFGFFFFYCFCTSTFFICREEASAPFFLFPFFPLYFTIIIYSARYAACPCRVLLGRDFPYRRYSAVAGVVDGIYFS